MKKIIVAGIALFCSGWIGSVVAGSITWNTIVGNGSCTSDTGNSCTFTGNDGEILKARAYATNDNDGSGTFKKATLTIWDAGLGVKNTDDFLEDYTPNHAADNFGKNDLVVFEYASLSDFITYEYTGFEIGWKFLDADINVWIGGSGLSANYDFTGIKFSELAGLGFTKFDFNNVPINSQQNLVNAPGPYLLLAPKLDDFNDFFKISQINGKITEERLPAAEIPEPGSIALFGAALIGLWANRRKRS